MRYLDDKIYGTVLEVDTAVIVNNLNFCRQKIGENVGVVPIVKASAYGHGALETALLLQHQKVDYLAVAYTSEGIALRRGGITMPIIVLNADADSFEELIRHRLEPEIYNFVSLAKFTALLRAHGEEHYPIHIKLDTGMHRLGFGATDVDKLIEELCKNEPWVRVATIFSHLAAADDPAYDDFTRRQIALFDEMSLKIMAKLSYSVRRHIANTSGIDRFPEARFDLVRLGLGLYKNAATLKTRIINITELAAGETVGYGRSGKIVRKSIIATIPIGYADGLNRLLSNGKWSVSVSGQRAPIVGNVCMDSCMIDITGIAGVEIGDEAVIFSTVAGSTVEDMAGVLNTIPYEVLTSISARVKRIYTNE